MLPKWLTAESQGENQQTEDKAASANPNWTENTKPCTVIPYLPDRAKERDTHKAYGSPLLQSLLAQPSWPPFLSSFPTNTLNRALQWLSPPLETPQSLSFP